MQTRFMWCLGLRKLWTKSAEAHQVAKEAPKRSKGRPAKGETENTEKKQATSVKNLRYVLLKNPENL